MKKVLITILFFYLTSCNVKEKEHPEGATTKDSSGTSAIVDSSKGVTNAVISIWKLYIMRIGDFATTQMDCEVSYHICTYPKGIRYEIDRIYCTISR